MKRRIYLVLAIVIGMIYIILSALYPHLERVMWFRTVMFVAFIFFVLFILSDGKGDGK
ncbi:hypothetical protein [Staphylococcus pettenkoferi]|uniref:hypothetical protein n=1 Tax=Staphylococcus pettenkoferi TaxID=170573 RepID=UPI000A975210|nr:hypothetical protein [Staphylococcus pettenkoferi]MCI2802692.1 hypothetical protein [Staphylococcus pettenkoferi]MCY1574264.1 hypothetical protein [Staphylococcus pettenkoferi]MCY1577585.1 hypothetical protein [Staphylococcus pettenkoferi]MCY1585115.1 hypothetical protein [Staphylococcus pettenkoferi]MCY1614956.1 hypothetical protein [Staphylococcus pettenkoferi]